MSTVKTLLLVVALPLVFLFSLAGCDDDGTGPDIGEVDPQEHRSVLQRNMTPVVSAAAGEILRTGNHEFALALLRELDGEDNLLISPLSIRIAFAMIYAGARGQTATEMDLGLAYGLDQAVLHPAMNAIDLSLETRNDPGDADHSPVIVELANSIWGRSGFPFAADYLDLLAVNYGAGLFTVDFVNEPEASRLAINDWVAEGTYDRIRDLLPPRSITSDTAVVLTNALYFCAPWADAFLADATTPAGFTLLDGTSTSVQMMRTTAFFSYYEETGCQVIEMPFRGGELSMVLLLPAAGQFESFAAALDVEVLDRVVGGLQARNIRLHLPRFSFEYTCRLKAALSSMGMVVPFTAAADFSGVAPNGGLLISDAYHKTFINVDEKGTEAAAATAVVSNVTSEPGIDHVFRADRPFLFLIRDIPTDMILFLGRVVEPE